MKAILFCLLNFFICFFAQAQTYHSFVHDTAIWSETEYEESCCDPGYASFKIYQVNFIMMGDTAINTLGYKKIFYQLLGCSSSGICTPCISNGVSVPILVGFLREDSSRKVFFLNYHISLLPIQCSQESFDTEKILYDFALSVGDTVSWKPYNNIVIEIDSVQAPNSEFLRRIKFDNQQDFWIEGLGSSFAFFGSYMPPPFECGCELSCEEASDLLPLNSPPPCGGIINAVNDLQTERKLQLSPNPFTDFISLSSPFQSSSILSVMNSQGQIILKGKLQPFEKISFTKNELPAEGIVFFRLISDEGVSQSAIAVCDF